MATRTQKKTKLRDAEATQKRILAAAKKEFAMNGFSGARVDVIAERAKANKRMIYHYFNSKDELFRHVLEQAYTDIRTAEQGLELSELEPRDALEKLVRFIWNYYLKNPEFLSLVNSENLHKARHLRKSKIINALNRRMVATLEDLLERGVAAGDFRPGVDPIQLNLTISSIGYYYLTNRFTGTIAYERDLMSPAALSERLDFNIETVMRMVCTRPPA